MTRAGAFETIVGLVVIGVAIVFSFYAFGVNDSGAAGDRYRLDAVFGRVDGISEGADVKIAGVKIGTVTDNLLDLDTYEATLVMAINRKVQVPEDSIAKIASDGFLGGAHVAIEPGASEEYLREGEKITITRGSVDILNLAVQAFTNPPAGGGNAPEPEDDPLGDF